MPIDNAIIDEIYRRVDLIEIASEYLNLKKSGENFKALCPFHTEKTPSFTISQKKQIFHCFGCGVGGNVFTFLMKMENIEFPEAIRRLASRYGISLSFSPKDGEKEELYKINELAKEFFRQNLEAKEAKLVREYLQQRGLSKESISSFELGYAPKGWCGFRDLAVLRGFSLSQIEMAGLIIKRDGALGEKLEDYYDRFRNRLIFPICNLQGRVVGFGGRILNNDEGPKYINSPETPIYNKGQILYGMNLGKDAIRKLQEALIVEGYMDTIIAHQYGFCNTVGTCGTTLTQDHARLLSRFTKSVILVYDPDPAGVKASLRGLDILNEEGLSVKVVELLEGLDPADFLVKRGEILFRKSLSSSKRLFTYRLSKALEGVDISSAEGKAKVVEEVIPTILKTKDPIQQHASIKELAETLHLGEEIILSEVKARNKTKKLSPFQLREYIKSEEIGLIECERGLIRLILLDEGIRERVWDELKDEEFVDPIARKIAHLLKDSTLAKEELRIDKILGQLNEEEGGIISSLLLKEDTGGNRLRLMQDYITRIKQNRLNRGIMELKERIEEAEKLNDLKGLKSLLNQYQSMVKELKLLGQGA